MSRISVIALAALLSVGLPACTDRSEPAPSVTAGSGAPAASALADPAPAPQAPKIAPLDAIPAWADAASVSDAAACYADSLNGEGGGGGRGPPIRKREAGFLTHGLGH